MSESASWGSEPRGKSRKAILGEHAIEQGRLAISFWKVVEEKLEAGGT